MPTESENLKLNATENTSIKLRTVFKNWSVLLSQLTTGQLAGLLFLVVLLLQMPLIVNPGYFSHDELQWAARADVNSLADLAWIPWFDTEQYQFRPLTFNLWLLLSYGLFNQPVLFHALVVLWGSLNAVLLFLIATQYFTKQTCAAGVGLFFVMSPYALYVHGWVATMADLLVMTALLLMLLLIIIKPDRFFTLLISMFLMVLALMSKESAFSIPAVLGTFWLFDGRKKSWLIPCLMTGMLAAGYLYLRLPVLLLQPEETHYSLSFWHVPWRWLEYHLYWLMPNTGEPNSTLSLGLQASSVVAILLVLVLLVSLRQTNQRLTLAWILGGLATLLPILPIASSAGQYGYLFSACCSVLLIAIYQQAKGWHKQVIRLAATLSLIHAVVIMAMIYQVGRIQSVFSPQLAAVITKTKIDKTINLKLADGARPWIFQRLTHDIPSYQGVPMGNKIKLVSNFEDADFLIYADGQIRHKSNSQNHQIIVQ